MASNLEFSSYSSAIMSFGVLMLIVSISTLLSNEGLLGLLGAYIAGLCAITVIVWGFVYDV